MPLQAVVLHCEKVAGIERIVADEFENISVKGIRTGFNDSVHCSPGVHTVRGILRASCEPELLQRVGKRERHARTVVVVDMGSAVQRILNPITVSACYRYIDARSRMSAAGSGLYRHA